MICSGDILEVAQTKVWQGLYRRACGCGGRSRARVALSKLGASKAEGPGRLSAARHTAIAKKQPRQGGV